jgi:hypothetical protein
MGTKLNAPLSKYSTVYALPMLTISDKKTTGKHLSILFYLNIIYIIIYYILYYINIIID